VRPFKVGDVVTVKATGFRGTVTGITQTRYSGNRYTIENKVGRTVSVPAGCLERVEG